MFILLLILHQQSGYQSGVKLHVLQAQYSSFDRISKKKYYTIQVLFSLKLLDLETNDNQYKKV